MDVEEMARQYLIETDIDEKGDIIGNIYRALDKLIIKTCNKYSGYAEFDDLKQESFFGVLRALETWEPDKRTFFGHVKDHLSWHLYRFVQQSTDGRGILREYQQYVNYEERYFSAHGVYPRDKTIALYFRVDVDRVRDIKKRAQIIKHTVSMDECFPGTDIELKETIADDTQDTEDTVLRECACEEIRSAVSRLPIDERKVIEKKYFASTRERMTSEDRNIYERAYRHLQGDKKLRALAEEEYYICKAYNWHNPEISHTEWSALRLAEGKLNIF